MAETRCLICIEYHLDIPRQIDATQLRANLERNVGVQRFCVQSIFNQFEMNSVDGWSRIVAQLYPPACLGILLVQVFEKLQDSTMAGGQEIRHATCT